MKYLNFALIILLAAWVIYLECLVNDLSIRTRTNGHSIERININQDVTKETLIKHINNKGRHILIVETIK
jgi:hypothetical protein